ncbi:hypothetical protein F4560_006664 [Saccharothrix ecbatanensis]|uniref:DUF5753 domain-containing protein n=1 Tax=Saccharothrix ecbatanensis TaxID=1105145 RepID=A0A7W9HRJ4_9PSEU|nr:DUF5753 domain-containing protein [Saccharothrix ecbatanensis]MBB5806896.1 hypothetical protein [Saccharothrix ecbatanensis]
MRAKESALRKIVGGPEVMREQLEHLRRMAELPNVAIRVLANGRGAHLSMIGGFTLLGFPEPDEPEVLYIEYLFGALHIEDMPQLREAELAFAHLASQALGPEESIALIERILAE